MLGSVIETHEHARGNVVRFRSDQVVSGFHPRRSVSRPAHGRKEVPTSCERYRRSNHESVQIEISTVRREAPRSIIGFLPL